MVLYGWWWRPNLGVYIPIAWSRYADVDSGVGNATQNNTINNGIFSVMYTYGQDFAYKWITVIINKDASPVVLIVAVGEVGSLGDVWSL